MGFRMSLLPDLLGVSQMDPPRSSVGLLHELQLFFDFHGPARGQALCLGYTQALFNIRFQLLAFDLFAWCAGFWLHCMTIASILLQM